MPGFADMIVGLFGRKAPRGPVRATVIHAPDLIPLTPDDPRPRVFLSGSIGTGESRDWRRRITEALSDLDITLLDPQRAEWDSSWTERADDPQLREQVEWELEALEASRLVIMAFSEESESPITLLEFGLYARTGRLIVFCPDGFGRKGNVEVTANYYGVKQVDSLEALAAAARGALGASHRFFPPS